MMTPLDILAKNHPDKQKSRLDRLNKNGTPKKPQDTQRLVCCLPGGNIIQRWIQERGPGGRSPPLVFIFIFFRPGAPLSQSLDDSPLPPYVKVWISHCNKVPLPNEMLC